MNDFTKEQLEEILDGLDDYWRLQPENSIIMDKIQSLIDNYCDHKKIETGAYSRSHPPKKCDACGVLYYE